MIPSAPLLRTLSTTDLTLSQILSIRELMLAAFGTDDEDRFTDDDWAHTIGGLHFVLELDGMIVGHAAIVEREIHVDGRPLRTGYVEAVAVAPDHQGAGFGSLIMHAVSDDIRDRFELGLLGTGRHGFYERYGWRTWQGPSGVRTGEGIRLTPDDDGYLMALVTPTSPPLDPAAPITCDWRPGDVW